MSKFSSNIWSSGIGGSLGIWGLPLAWPFIRLNSGDLQGIRHRIPPLVSNNAPPAPPAPAGVVLLQKRQAANEIAACGTGVRLIDKYTDHSESWQAPINIYQVPTVFLIPRSNMQNIQPLRQGAHV